MCPPQCPQLPERHRVAVPLPSIHGEESRVEGTGSIHPHISKCVLGSPILNPEEVRFLWLHKPHFQSTPAVPGCARMLRSLRELVARGMGGPVACLWSSMCHLRVPAIPFILGFVFPPRPL